MLLTGEMLTQVRYFLLLSSFDLYRVQKLISNMLCFCEQAESIGKAAQEYMGSLSMDRVYDYMYHLLNEYSKLQDFTPVKPSFAMEICHDSVLCFADENQREFLQKSASSPSPTPPCSLPH